MHALQRLVPHQPMLAYSSIGSIFLSFEERLIEACKNSNLEQLGFEWLIDLRFIQ
jgi:hypothetical protein